MKALPPLPSPSTHTISLLPPAAATYQVLEITDEAPRCGNKPEISETLHTVLTSSSSTFTSLNHSPMLGPGTSAGRDLQTTWKTNYPKLAGSR